MLVIAIELGKLIAFLILTEANPTFIFITKCLWVIWNSVEICYDLWNLAVRKTTWSSLLPFKFTFDHAVNKWSATEKESQSNYREKSIKKNQDHNNKPKYLIWMILTIVSIREVKNVTPNDYCHNDYQEYDG